MRSTSVRLAAGLGITVALALGLPQSSVAQPGARFQDQGIRDMNGLPRTGTYRGYRGYRSYGGYYGGYAPLVYGPVYRPWIGPRFYRPGWYGRRWGWGGRW